MKFWGLKHRWNLPSSPQDGRRWVVTWWTAVVVLNKNKSALEEVVKLFFPFISAFLFFSPDSIPLHRNRPSQEVSLKKVLVELLRNIEVWGQWLEWNSAGSAGNTSFSPHPSSSLNYFLLWRLREKKCQVRAMLFAHWFCETGQMGCIQETLQTPAPCRQEVIRNITYL